jgi:type I restriction enzyme, S subunit
MSAASMQWPIKRIGDLATVVRGSSPRPIADQRYFIGGDIPWIKIADATKSGKYLYETKEHVNEFGASFSRKLPVGSLIVAASGTLGYTQMLGVSGCVHDGWLYLTDFRGVDKHYLYYFCQWKKDHFYNSAYGAAIQNINTEILRNTEIALPPIRVQERIASILSAYDDLVENNTRRIKILEEMAQTLYREWFVALRFPGHQNVRMVESELGPLPEGWAVKRLGDVAGVNDQSIKNSSSPDEINYIDIASVSTARIEKKEPMSFADAPGRARRIVRHGDTIWSTVRPNRRSYALILNPEPNLIVSTGFAVLTAATVPYSYLYFAATTNEFADYLTNHATGSAYPAVSAKDFDNAKLVVPEASVGNGFHEVTAPMLDLSWCLHQRNINLRTTRDFLLPKLISGEIPVEAACEATAEVMEQTA